MFEKFIYDGISSLMQGILVVHFQEEDLTQSGGSSCELISYKNSRTNKWRLTSTNYTEPLQFTIQIINIDKSPIDTVKERHLNRWLLGQKNQYKWLQIEKDNYMDIQFRCKFINPQRLVAGGITRGMQYTIICDAPWGYSPVRTKIFSSGNGDSQLYIHNDSDEFDYIYPQLKIISNEECNLKITNTSEKNPEQQYFLLENLAANETVSIDNENQIITTDRQSHSYILGDFNKRWLRLVYGDNYFTFSNSCEVEVKYRTVRKAGAL